MQARPSRWSDRSRSWVATWAQAWAIVLIMLGAVSPHLHAPLFHEEVCHHETDEEDAPSSPESCGVCLGLAGAAASNPEQPGVLPGSGLRFISRIHGWVQIGPDRDPAEAARPIRGPPPEFD